MLRLFIIFGVLDWLRSIASEINGKFWRPIIYQKVSRCYNNWYYSFKRHVSESV